MTVWRASLCERCAFRAECLEVLMRQWGTVGRRGIGAEPDMAAPYSSSWSRTAGRLYWLPPGGIGNGLDAQTWAALIDADASD
jgi:hypothetical protein